MTYESNGLTSESPFADFNLCGQKRTSEASNVNYFADKDHKINLSIIFEKTLDLLLSFNNDFGNPEEHLQTQQNLFDDIRSNFEKKMIKDLFINILDRGHFMKTIYRLFTSSKMGKRIDKNDPHNFAKFEILTHVICFDATSWDSNMLLNIFRDYDWPGAGNYYRFILKESRLGSVLIHEILHIYSPEYVREIILPNIVYSHDLISKADFLKRHLTARAEMTFLKPTITIPTPFKFHGRVRPKQPMKEMEIVHFRAQPIPKAIYFSPRPSELLENNFRKNHLKAKQLMEDIINLENKSKVYQDEIKSSKYYETVSKIKAEREHKANKMPIERVPIDRVLQSPKTKPRSTFSTNLKLRQICKKDELGKVKMVDDMVYGKCEEILEQNLKYERMEKGKLEKAEREKRAIDVKLSYFRAIEATKKTMATKLQLAKMLKEESVELARKKAEEEEHEAEISRQAAAALAELRKHAKEEARVKSKQEAEKLANDRKKLIEETRRQAEIEKAREYQENLDKINRIKAMAWFERAQSSKSKVIKREDQSSMSKTEMVLRLQLSKEEKNHELNMAHTKVLNERRQKIEKSIKMNQEIQSYFENKKVKSCLVRKPDYSIPVDPEVLKMKKQLENMKAVHSEKNLRRREQLSKILKSNKGFRSGQIQPTRESSIARPTNKKSLDNNDAFTEHNSSGIKGFSTA